MSILFHPREVPRFLLQREAGSPPRTAEISYRESRMVMIVVVLRQDPA